MTRELKSTARTALPRVVTPALIRQALACISPDVDRDTWVRLGMAVKAELGADGFDLWNDWSAQAKGYSLTDARDTWRSIKAGGRVTVGTLFGIAKKHGFRFPGDDGPALSATELAAQAAKVDADRVKREAARLAEEAQYRARAELAKRDAAQLWAQATEEGASSYLQRKGVAGHGVRYLANGTLLVPVRDLAGELHNLQRIAPRKPTAAEEARGVLEKLFLPGGRKAGLLHWIGDPGQLDVAAPVLCLAEGYATAASIHEATGRPVVVCFDAGNLVAVAKLLRPAFPAAWLLVCGDDDRATAERTGKNPGREKAEAAARAARTAEGPAVAIFPEGLVDLAPEGSDFNDLAAAAGLDAVARIVDAGVLALQAPAPSRPARRARKSATDKANATSEGQEAFGGSQSPSGPRAVGDAESLDASADVCTEPAPGVPGGRDPFRLDELGVWFVVRDSEGNERPPQWVCAALHVEARTRDDAANGWGYLLEFTDPDGNAKQWAMPVAMLSGEGAEWAARLADMGLEIAHGAAARGRLGQYIKTRRPGQRVTCTDRVGWHGGSYVLPSRCIGGSEGRRYVFQSESGMEDTFRMRGDLETWRTTVAALCEGNSRFVFATSCAFAGALLLPASVESGGFHFRSGSSQGKTSALRISASVWGRADYVKRWRTTDNALEATAVQHSDGLLILDEIAQLDASKAGECAYMLANEQEKGRNTRGGLNRKQRTWRLLFLSSGEVSLSTHMAEAGKRVMAGQEVRMVDIPLDAGQGMGGVEELHGYTTPGALVEAITAAAARCYGVAGRAWLEWACEHQAELSERLAAMVEAERDVMLPNGGAEQVRRVARRFALVAAAGELASEADITGWPANTASDAARRCFVDWLAARGHMDNGEDAQALAQVKAWIEKNGDALLTWLHRVHDDHRPNTALRAGFKRQVDDQGKPIKFDGATDYMEKRSAVESSEKFNGLTEYLILPEAWKREICKGLDGAAVADLLRRRGHLDHEVGRLTRSHRVPGMGKVKLYHLKASILADEL